MKKLLKITEITTLPESAQFLNYQRYRSQILITQTEDLNEDCVESRLYLFARSRNKLSKNVMVGLGQARSGQAGSLF